MLADILYSLQWYGPGCGAVNPADNLGTLSAGIKGYAKQTATIEGVGSIPAAHVTGLKNSPAIITGTGEIITANPKGNGKISASVFIGFKPSAFDIAQAVLNAETDSYNIPDTIGSKINAAGAGGDPWASEIVTDYSAKETLRIILAVLAGKTLGARTKRITFRDINDTKDRVVVDFDTTGNRSGVTVDVSD